MLGVRLKLRGDLGPPEYETWLGCQTGIKGLTDDGY